MPTEDGRQDLVESVLASSATPILEVAVQDLDGVDAAISAGADQIELCTALSTGGLTPSIGVVESAAHRLTESMRMGGSCRGLNVLVRPRTGGFFFTSADLTVARADIRQIRAVPGVTGIVIGALDRKGGIDRRSMEQLMVEAGGVDVVYHRAIDALDDPLSALDDIAEVGCRRVLSSGGRATSVEGARTLRAMVEHAAGRVEIMAGGGVRVEDIPGLLDLGVRGVHLSARRSVEDGPAGPGGGSSTRWVTDRDIIGRARQQLDRAQR